MAKKETKQRIMLEAFKLFAQKPYDAVTFLDIENATGLSRGAIMYYFSNKEDMFKQVVDTYILNDYQINVPATPIDISLKSFFEIFLKQNQNAITKLKEIGFPNINIILVNITMQAIHFYPNWLEQAYDWEGGELERIEAILKQAVLKGEIKKNINIKLIASLIYNIFLGTSYAGMGLPNGVDLDLMKKEFNFIYDVIKE